MKKSSLLLTMFLLLISLLTGCGSSSKASTSQPPSASQAEETKNAPAGDKYDNDKFSLIVPAGWITMEIDGGIQLFKTTGEVFELHFRGYNLNDSEAKTQVESLAKQYDGTEVKETDLLGKRFWSTTYTASDVPQTANLLVENGVLLTIMYGGPEYESNPDFQAIIDSVVFK